MVEKRFLNVKELALYLGVSEGTLYAWVCYRKIPFLKISRLVKFDKQKIDQWVQEKAIELRG